MQIQRADFHVLFEHIIQLEQHIYTDVLHLYLCVYTHTQCEILQHLTKFVKTRNILFTVWTKRSISL